MHKLFITNHVLNKIVTHAYKCLVFWAGGLELQ